MEERLRETPEEVLEAFGAEELELAPDAGPARAAFLAARLAAKEAACALVPDSVERGQVGPRDFVVVDVDASHEIEVSAAGRAALDWAWIERLELTFEGQSAHVSAVRRAMPKAHWSGSFFFNVIRFRRRVVLDNLRLVFGKVLSEEELHELAKAFYAHFLKFLVEVFRLPWMSTKRKAEMIRVENLEAPLKAYDENKGLFFLSGHFGNWEVATVAGIGQLPQYRGQVHVIRKQLNPAILNAFVTWRFKRAGIGTLSRRGALNAALDLLEQGNVVLFVFDQHARGSSGVQVEFLGEHVATLKSLAILAMSTEAAVIPVSTWREEDGTHVLRFEDPLPTLDCEDTNEAVRLNSRTYNVAMERMVLRHPEQWIWMHKRWKKKGR